MNNRLRGCIVATYATHKGKRLGPYYVRSWKENGRQRKEYIKPADLHRVQEAIENYKIHRARAREIKQVYTLLTRNLNFLHTMARRSAKQILETDQYTHLARLANDLLTPNPPHLRKRVNRTISRPLHPSSFRLHPSQNPAFMYPSHTSSEPPATNAQQPTQSTIPSSALRVPSSELPVPSSSEPAPFPTREYLAAKYAEIPASRLEQNPKSAKSYQDSLPKRKKVIRNFFIRQGQGEPEREVNDVQVWFKSPAGEPNEDTDEIYESYSEPDGPDDPTLTPETTWINPNFNPNPDLTTRPIYKFPWL